MRADRILLKILGDGLAEVHAARVSAVFALVQALLRSERISLTALGRSLAGCPKHQIKRVDYMLGNWRLHRELSGWYAALARFTLKSVARPIILVDWTQVVGDFYALSAMVPFAGRSLPLYHEVHPRRRHGNRQVHRQFLERLRALLPGKCAPIIVADAGFRSPFFLACRLSGFDYVVRLRGKAKIWRRGSESTKTRSLSQLFAAAQVRPQCLGEWTPFDSSRGGLFSRIVLAARPVCSRRRRGKQHPQYRRSAREPWVLATSIGNETAAQIVAIYAARMKIEETFRDLKNPRFGWSLTHSASRSIRRYDVLMLLASLALVVVMLVGAAAETTDIRFRYQANTIRCRSVLSVFALGRLVIRDVALLRCAEVVRQIACVAAFVVSLLPRRRRHTRYGPRATHAVACPHHGRGWIR